MVQWLGLHGFTAEVVGSIPGRGTKIPQAVWPKKKKDFQQIFQNLSHKI